MQGISIIPNDFSENKRDEIARLIQIKIDGSLGVSAENGAPKYFPWSVYAGEEIAEKVRNYCESLGWTYSEAMEGELWTITYRKVDSEMHYFYKSANKIEAVCLAALGIMNH